MSTGNYGNNVNEFYVSAVRKNFAERAVRIAALKDKADAEKYVAEIREKIDAIFNFPERTPLDAAVTGKKSFPGYTLETLYYYSRPDYPVTADLLLPENFSGRIPGVLFVCGHASEGKASATYMAGAVSLALKGFAVLIIDPVEQGERLQYENIDNPRGGLCQNHNLMGKQQALVGEWFGSWRTWDAVRGLDYLESRPEIDPSQLYVTGNSGGGTLTTWVAAADPRPIAVAPSCYVTSWKRNTENELPADIEQIPPRTFEYGLEMADFLLAQAPRRILILGQKKDFFDPRGTEETYREVERINGLLGGETKLHIGPDFHGYSLSNRCAMYEFFTGSAEEPELNIPSAEDSCAVSGSISNIPGQRFLREFTADKVDGFKRSRKKYDLDSAVKLIKQLLNIGEVGVPYCRVLRPDLRDDAKYFSRFALETEKDQIMAVLTRHASNDDPQFYNFRDQNSRALIFIPDMDAQSEIFDRTSAEGETLYGLDVRGFGELLPAGCDQWKVRDFYNAYQFDYHYASLGMMIGTPIISGRVKDILSAVELLDSVGYSEISLEGSGNGAVPALLAALLSDKVKTVKLVNCIDSFESVAKAVTTDFPLSGMVPDILKFIDLPELRELICDKIVK